MSDIKVSYSDIESAAAAVKKAAADVQRALATFRSATGLHDSAFTSKGEQAATWYDKQRSTLLQAGQAGEESYQHFGEGFDAVATLFQAFDKAAAKAAHNHGGSH